MQEKSLEQLLDDFARLRGDQSNMRSVQLNLQQESNERCEESYPALGVVTLSELLAAWDRSRSHAT